MSETSQNPRDCMCSTWATSDFAGMARGNGHHPACELFVPNVTRVFKLNDCDWYMAPTLEEAIAHAVKLTDIPRDEMVDNPHELTDAELLKLKYTKDDETKITFAEHLAQRIAAGKLIEFFASTEF